MRTKTDQLCEQIAALAALPFDRVQIVDGRVTNPEAAARLLQALEVHVRALVNCAPRPTPARIQAAPVDTSAMTHAELFAHYKRTAPAEDLRFFLRGRLSDALHARAEAIRKPTTQDLTTLHAAWRLERQAEERAAGIPAIGTAEWHRQQIDQDADLPTDPADVQVHVAAGGVSA